MVATSAMDVAPVMPAPLTVAVLLTKVPDVRAGVTVTTIAEKLLPDATAAVLVHVTTVVVDVPQFQPDALMFDCVSPVGSESLMVTVWPPVDPGPLLPAVIVYVPVCPAINALAVPGPVCDFVIVRTGGVMVRSTHQPLVSPSLV